MLHALSVLARWIVILTLGPYLLVVFHEAGHFVAARVQGIGIYEYSVGEGPLLCQGYLGNTKFKLHLFPTGGYNIPVHTGLSERIDPEELEYLERERPEVIRMLEDKGGYVDLRGPWQRFFVYSAGLGVQLVIFTGMIWWLVSTSQRRREVSHPVEMLRDLRRRIVSPRAALWLLVLHNVRLFVDNLTPMPGLDGFFMFEFAAELMYGPMDPEQVIAILQTGLPYIFLARLFAMMLVVWLFVRHVSGRYVLVRQPAEAGAGQSDTKDSGSSS